MSSVSPLNSGSSWDQMMALQGAGAPPDDAQSTKGANDAFAALFAQMMAAKQPAQSTDTGPASSSQTGASGLSGLSGLAASAPAATDSTSQNQAMAAGNVSAAQLAHQSQQADNQKPNHHFWSRTPDAASTSSGEADLSAASRAAVNDPQMRSLLMGLT